MADKTDLVPASDRQEEHTTMLTMGASGLAMPPRRPRWERVQVNARVRVEIEHVLQRFVRDHDTTVQGCVDLALEEFLNARGYGPLVASDAAAPHLEPTVAGIQ